MNLFSLRRTPPSLDDLTAEYRQSTRHDSVPHDYLMPAIERPAPVFVRGQGSRVWDAQGQAYLDFSQGGGSNCLGHSPGVLARALSDQAYGLLNAGVGFHNQGQLNLAQRLCETTACDQVHFFNSGSEACDGAIKLARKWGQLYRGGACRIISVSNACHGSGFGAMAASTPGVFDNRFEPQLPGFSQVPFNDLAALHAAVDAKTVAIMLEPIQNAAGVIPASGHYLKGVERLCRELGILLILDEVQTGMGRCGTLLVEQQYGVRADIITLGKGLGGGVPLAALLARGRACCFAPAEIGGSHHGNALMCSAGLAVLDTLLGGHFLAHVRESGQYLQDGLTRLAQRHDQGELRGTGLLWGLTLGDEWADALVKAARQEGLLLDAPKADCLRFTPALNVSKSDIDEMLLRLGHAFSRVRTAQVHCRKGIAV
ncbi:aminotransferase class III-fold pyridoxal phosphate-dependent enzyme [Pseudomonas sp. FEN]|uniref:aminotransferase class III-fold pyridoxal phosphate-dependent enzyme n=1 Tax=Pseudomonas sp. FEN TaxID=2767468 RepID=UPI00174AD23B|nr:aminotransferase class III-fold pyridoxal phosphate-dependent enzyme [Pseudomonas sp. FEN]